MAKNIDVIHAFINGADKPKTKNLRIEYNKLINYNTVIAECDGNQWIVNVTKYSQSTTTIQNALIKEMSNAGLENCIKFVTEIKRGVNSLT